MEEAAEDLESADAVEIQQTASITEPDLRHSLQTQDDGEIQTPAETALAKVEDRAH